MSQVCAVHKPEDDDKDDERSSSSKLIKVSPATDSRSSTGRRRLAEEMTTSGDLLAGSGIWIERQGTASGDEHGSCHQSGHVCSAFHSARRKWKWPPSSRPKQRQIVATICCRQRSGDKDSPPGIYLQRGRRRRNDATGQRNVCPFAQSSSPLVRVRNNRAAAAKLTPRGRRRRSELHNRSLWPATNWRQLAQMLLLLLFLLLCSSFRLQRAPQSTPSLVAAAQLATEEAAQLADGPSNHVIYVKVGALLEESDHEQANMFIRTIKMINERNEQQDTIGRLLSNSAAASISSFSQLRARDKSRRGEPEVAGKLRAGDRLEAAVGGRSSSSGPVARDDDHQAAHNGVSSGRPEAGGSQLKVNRNNTNDDDYDNDNGDAMNDAHDNDPEEEQRRRFIGGAKSYHLAQKRKSHHNKSWPAAEGSNSGAQGEGLGESVSSSIPIGNESTSASARHLRSLELTNSMVVKLEPMIEFLADRQSSFEADFRVCQLIESGAHALIGPLDGASIQHVQSICDNMEIPYFEFRPFIGSPPAPAVNSFSSPPSSSASDSTSGGAHRNVNGAHQHQRGTGTPTTSGAGSGVLVSNSSQQQPPEVAAGSVDPADSGRAVESPPSLAPGAKQQTAGGSGPKQPQATMTSAAATITNPANVNRLEDLTINLYPPAHLLTGAYIDLIYAWNWTSFAIVYEDGSSMIKLQDLFKESSSGSWTSKWRIKLFQFDRSSTSASASAPSTPKSGKQSIGDKTNNNDNNDIGANNNNNNHHEEDDGGDRKPQESSSSRQAPPVAGASHQKGAASFRDLFWRIKESGEQNILLDVRTGHLFEALKQAQQVGCMTEKFSYLITSLDLHTIDLEDFKYSRTRLTAFSMIQVARPGSDELFDEKYLERLGVHVIEQEPAESSSSQADAAGGQSPTVNGDGTGSDKQQQAGGYRLSPSVVLDKWGQYMEPPADAYKDWSRREMLMSSPASMGLLPSVDRDNEQRLFEFFLEQQGRHLSRVRLSTASAILHDSLLLYTLGLHELDPSGSLLGGSESSAASGSSGQPSGEGRVSCSPNSVPWLHGSSLVNYMRRLSFTGLTGPISFDQRGLRTDFRLDMMGMAPNLGLVKVGEWHSSRLPAASAAAAEAEEELAAGSEGAAANQKAPLTSSAVASEQRKSYDEQSRFYHLELRRYRKLLGEGQQIRVPYSRLLPGAGSGKQVASIGGRFASPQRSEGGRQAAPSASRSSSSGGGSLLVNEIIYERLYKEQEDQVDMLIVTTKLSQPYFMLKETPNKLEGNDQYEGFAVDLIHELSKLVNFRYKWREVADKKYGSKEVLPNGTVRWNGMIGEIVRGQADLAIVDLTITAQREEAVDFTLPFMNTGISILFKKPTTKVTTLFSFLSPFSADVWAYVLAAYCGISAILFLVGHLSPYEWADPHPCRHFPAQTGNSLLSQSNSTDREDSSLESSEERNQEPAAASNWQPPGTILLRNQFSLLNSFWFTIGSLMQQGSDLTPRSMSTRTIAGIWYFFTLIMISSYTANLAAFLTVEKVVYPIENVRDLSQQQEIRYGCVESGSTCTFFHDSQIDTYKRINETMRRFRTYVRSNDEGQKRVEEGNFAFFMESASIEYIVERNCNLTQIGGLLDSKGYGLATSKKSRLRRPYRTLLSEGILHLQETGMLHVLKNRWWKERRGGGTCTDDGKGGGVTELSLANVGGVFVVLLGGLGISFLVAIAEFMWRARRQGSSRDKMCEEMMSDLKFALACKRSMKPVNRQPAKSSLVATTTTIAATTSGSGVMAAAGYRNILAAANDPCGNHFMSSSAANRQLLPGGRSLASAAAQSGAKDCDPILLHAMLTLLTQQQEQMNGQPPFMVDTSGPLFGHEANFVLPPTAGAAPVSHQQQSSAEQTDFAKSQASRVRRKKQQSHESLVQRQLAHEMGRQQQQRRPGSAMVESLGRRLAGDSYQGSSLSNSDEPQAALKRRLLFAQRTIDTADDTLNSTMISHALQQQQANNLHALNLTK